MNIGARLEAIGSLVPRGVSIADIGTDHAYLPAWLAERNLITRAIAGDIAAGPCKTAANTVALYGLAATIEVRRGSGLAIIRPGEVEVIVIAGMGAGTMIEILEADRATALAAQKLILQPMAGAPSLRRWAHANGCRITGEVLVEEGRHLYEIMVLEPGTEAAVSDAAYEVGPRLLEQRPALLPKQIAKLRGHCRQLLENMEHSQAAQAGAKYRELQKLLRELEELDDGRYGQ